MQSACSLVVDASDTAALSSSPRLTKEEQTYVKEVQEQRERIKRVEADKDADEWNVKQQVSIRAKRHDLRKHHADTLSLTARQHKVLQDCLQMVPDCRRRLEAAVEDLRLFAEGLDEDLAATPEAQAAKEALQGAAAAVEEAAASSEA